MTVATQTRPLTYADAVREALEQSMEADPNVVVIGLGATDPKAIFGTTRGLHERFGRRVLDGPTAENGVTGIAIGAAIDGLRPVSIHQRADFALLALDQIANNAAKWHSMFGRRMKAPLTMRLLIGRGWGQGPQHSQALQAIFAHFPGLKVVMPSTPYDAKGLLMSAIADDDPVIIFEHRWLHGVVDDVPARSYTVPIGPAAIRRAGTDVTVAATSLNVLEALRAAELLEKNDGISVEVLDMRTIKPYDAEALAASIAKTGRLLAVDSGWTTLGFAGELVAKAAETCFSLLTSAPKRLCVPDGYVPTTPALANHYYPGTAQIVSEVRSFFGLKPQTAADLGIEREHEDVPDQFFQGPF